jgi:hypothetical protein
LAGLAVFAAGAAAMSKYTDAQQQASRPYIAPKLCTERLIPMVRTNPRSLILA